MGHTLSKDTVVLLDEIEKRIDPDTEEDFVSQWRDFLFDRFDGDIFSPVRKKRSVGSVAFAPVENINDALDSYDLMLRHQMQGVLHALNGTGGNLSIRANYGTGIMSSLFGAEIFRMPRSTNTLPTTRSVDDTEWIRSKLEGGMPNLTNGFGKNVFEFGELCAEVFERYPKIKKYVNVYHPDLQGPLDVCELLWGGEMFYAMYDEPELVHSVMALITETYSAFMDRWHALFPGNEDINPHWATLYHRGKIFLRSDSAMNLSPEMYREFSVPYDTLLLGKYGGGMHFCGRGDHYIDILCRIPGLYAVQMSQPHLNNMELIYKNTVDRGIKLLSLNKKVALADLGREGGFHHNLSC